MSSCGPRQAPDSRGARERLDLLDGEDLEPGRAGSLRLAVAAAGFDVRRQRAAFSGRRPKLKIAAQHLAVLVDAARADALARVRHEQRLDLRRS